MEFHENIHRDDMEISWKWHRYFMEIPYKNSLEFAIVIQYKDYEILWKCHRNCIKIFETFDAISLEIIWQLHE